MLVRAAIGLFVGLAFGVSLSAEPLLEGRVRLPSGAPVPGAQVLLFDPADLRAAPLAATTDRSGQFTLPWTTLSGIFPERFELGSNYPNPLNPSTMIPYQLPTAMYVRLEVFNLLGQRIAILVDGEQPAGFHTASWDATDASGEAVAAGVYLYRLSGAGMQATRSMVLIDGQAGISSGGSGPTGSGGEPGGADGEGARVYGLTVSGRGLVPYVDPAFQVEAGMPPLDLVVKDPGNVSSAKVASAGGILGDVDNTGGVGFFDALLVALYSRDPSIVMPNNGDISLGDVDADGQVELTDAWLIAVWLNDPSDPALPAGIGESVAASTASLSPDPSTVTFADDGAWHRFRVEAGEPVSVVANPGTTPRLEITTRRDRGNFCPAEADDDVSRRDGQAVYLAGCATGTATVELQRPSDGTVLNTYTFEVTGSPADLVVASVSVSDSSLTPGQSFTLRATVRNQGTARSGATTLQYYRSSNRTISPRDTLVGTDPVGALGASRTSSKSIRLTAPPSAGTWYYGACVAGVAGESAGNNCSTGVRVRVEAASPDLVVQSASVSDSSLTPGQSFTLSATVRNQGASQSAATPLRFYRSTDGTISASDTEVGAHAVSGLAASRTSSHLTNLTAPLSAGTYFYGACVESVSDESDTGNNCSAAVTVTVGTPDLVVDAPTVSTSTPTAGASFRLNATVRNLGSGASAATTLRYYRSDDGTVSASDTEVGTDPVGILSVSQTSSESISLTAPSSPGTYYYGACVESVSDESDTGNNCSLAVTVSVGAAPAPDLVVDSPSVSTSSPTAGASFRLSATVLNLGSGASAATTLRYYRSDDGTVSANDTQVGTDPVGILSVSHTSSESITLTAPSSPGTYYYGACVESVSDESDTGNNCSSAVAVTVGVPDLVVDAPTVSTSSPTAGQSFRLSATVRNQGNGQSGATTLRFYRSTNSRISASDTEVGAHAVSGLAASRTSSHSTNLTAPSSAGTYYYGACVESVSDETDTGNNCSAAVTVTVGAAPAPDLVVYTPTVSNSSPTAGASFTLRATVRNQGAAPSGSTTLRWYRSTDATVSTSDTEVGSDLVSSLSASRTSSESISLRAPSSAGTYYYGACVESVGDETDTGNNCSPAVTVTVGAAPAPDLVVDSPSVSGAYGTAGASFTLHVTVRNEGNGPSAATTLRFYRSTDATISASDTEVGSDAVRGLVASRSRNHSADLTVPSRAGTYYYGACLERVSDETDTGNNCSSAVTVTVGEGAAPAPDLVVPNPTASTSFPTAGASFTLNATVRNQGNGPSAATTLRFYRSDDGTISDSDTELGSDSVSGLPASGTSDHSIDLTAPSNQGTYYYGVCVGSVSDESDSGNNCSVAVHVIVGAAPAPNLWVVNESVSDSNPTAGQSFTLSATVSNAGNGQSAATTLRFYRSTDETISASDTEVGSHAVSALAASGTSDHSIDLTAPSSAGTYYYGACVDAVSGESVPDNNCSPGVTVTVGAAPAPDLVVNAPSVSNDSPTAGASFRLSATVRNQGNGPSAATTLRFYRSTDGTISAGDTEVGSDAVSGLSASRTSDHSTDLTAPSGEGYYYYGACVESVSYETDTGNNCSLAVPVYVRAPDLVVDLRSVSDHSPTAGASFSLSVTVRNQGTSQSAATTLRFYGSTDGTISASDTEVGTHAVSGLSASGTSDHSIDLTAPSSAGTWYYGACVESVSNETDTGNNCSLAAPVTVAPDLVVDFRSISDSSPTAGASFTLSATVRNQGTSQSAATTLRFYRSTDETISASDTEVGSDAVSGLSASGTSDHSTDLTAPSSPGTYYYGACVESVSGETDTGNNCSPAVTVTVVAAPVPDLPDLVVDSPTVSDSSPAAGTSLTLSATVRNQGNARSAATTLRFYRSTDATISASDTEVGSRDVGGMAASLSVRLFFNLTAPSSAGTYYYGACVESVSDESDTGNNCSLAVTVTVTQQTWKLYWTDSLTDKIQRSNLDGSGVEDLVTTGLGNPGGIALDVSGGKIYWADWGTDKIQRSSLDGSGVEDLVTTRLGNPWGIALDVSGGKIYWTDSYTDTDTHRLTGKIQRSNLDGSGVEDLVTTRLRALGGIALGLVPVEAGTD